MLVNKTSLSIYAALLCCSLHTQAMVALEKPTDKPQATQAVQNGGIITATNKRFITIDNTNYYLTHQTKRYDLNGKPDKKLVLKEGMFINFTIHKQYNKLNIIQLWLMQNDSK